MKEGRSRGKERKGKSGVFMDDSFLVVVPVYNYKKKLVAEVGIQVRWAMQPKQ